LVRVALIQMDVVLGSPEANRARAARMIGATCSAGCDLVVLPELWTTGYALDRIRDLAEPLNGETAKFLEWLAREYSAYIVGSIPELDASGRIYNTAVVVGPEGVAGFYRKVHLFKPMEEHLYFTPGDRVEVLNTRCGPIGVTICYDLRFPELFRKLTLKGARMVVVPAEWPCARVSHWEVLIKARALENQIFVAAVNRVGSDGRYEYCGASMIVDPWGAEVVKLGGVEAAVVVDIDLATVDRVRKLLPVLEDRRPDIY